MLQGCGAAFGLNRCSTPIQTFHSQFFLVLIIYRCHSMSVLNIESPFALPLCTCNEGPCPRFEFGESDLQQRSPESTSNEPGKTEVMRLEKTTCLGEAAAGSISAEINT